jgi:hypothetical protein
MTTRVRDVAPKQPPLALLIQRISADLKRVEDLMNFYEAFEKLEKQIRAGTEV